MSAPPVREVNPFGAAPSRRAAPPPREAPSAPSAPNAARGPSPVIRGLTGFEEELIEAEGRRVNAAVLCDELLARCMVAPGADPGEARQRVRRMLVAERDRALVELRVRSLGPDVRSVALCPSCGRSNEINFSLTALALDFAVPEGTVSLTLQDGVAAELRLPNAGDQEELLEEGELTAAERRTWLLARTLLKHGDREGPFDMSYARSLPLIARRQMEAALDAALPDLDFRMATTCAFCAADFAAPFDIPAFFLGS